MPIDLNPGALNVEENVEFCAGGFCSRMRSYLIKLLSYKCGCVEVDELAIGKGRTSDFE